nr:hypothetical protein [Tanacetum cinerariifolium]
MEFGGGGCGVDGVAAKGGGCCGRGSEGDDVVVALEVCVDCGGDGSGGGGAWGEVVYGIEYIRVVRAFSGLPETLAGKVFRRRRWVVVADRRKIIDKRLKHMLRGRLFASFQDLEHEDGDTRFQGGIRFKDNDIKIKIQDHKHDNGSSKGIPKNTRLQVTRRRKKDSQLNDHPAGGDC